MKLDTRAARALLACLAAAAPARAAAQDAEAWVLPRGLLELSATGLYTRWDARLGGAALGTELAGPYGTLADRLLDGRAEVIRAGLADLFASTADPEPGALPDSVTAGSARFRMAADVRRAPVTLRYGLTDRLTVFATVPVERSGTVLFGPHLAGGTLGLNPNAATNRAALEKVDARFGDLGGGLLLPTRDSPEGRELQSRLAAINPADTLNLPLRAVSFADLLAQEQLRMLLSAEEAAALAANSTRRPYHLGDLQVGARLLLIPGPRGWPFPGGRPRGALRTALGLRARLPTGSGDTRTATEVPPEGGHFGVGVDLLNDVFLSRRWMVSLSGSGDWLFPADVVRQAFGPERPFPADTALVTMRRAPGPRFALSVAPRWRLTDEISFAGEYAMAAQGETEYTAPEGVLPNPLEWRGGGAAHALGFGMRYSSLQAFSRRQARLPFEVTVSLSRTVAGSAEAPEAGTVRITGRIFMDPRRFRALLPREAPDTVIPPPAGPMDTLPSQLPPPQPASTVEPPPPLLPRGRRGTEAVRPAPAPWRLKSRP